MKKVNKTELKNFAVQSRRKLIEQVQTKAFLYGFDKNNTLEIQEQFGQLMINDKPYPLYMKSAFNSLKKQLEQKGYKQLIEEVAYTWFNRIIAIRYMEVHDYLPERVNVLSSSVGRVDPDILFEYETMDLSVKQDEIRESLNAGDTEGAYRQLFIAQCNALNSILSFLFEEIQDYTELLLPDFLLDAESVIKVLVQNEELTSSFEEIEVIGWLYQYYITEEKDRVFAQKSKYKKEEIPFATQLFTPKWIVQYMVQNSLGRYWTEAHREDEELMGNWEYFIKHEEENFYEKIAPYINKELKVEDIKLLDPAMGSGHILVYAFEVFYQIYEKCGYPEREIPRLIIENNLYGLDIDDRAYQLAAFAVVMKAASYSRRFLRSIEREGIQLNLASIQETNHVADDVIAYIAQGETGERYQQVKGFFKQYHNAKTYGSLINITERDITFIEERLEHIKNHPVEDLFYGNQHDISKEVLLALVQQTKIMRDEYDVVVMNPPYMGDNFMNSDLSLFLREQFSKSKSDLFSSFMELGFYLKANGMLSMINQHMWMFNSTYKNLRKSLFSIYVLDNMIHLGARAFEEINGEVVQSTAFVLRKMKISQNRAIIIKLTDIKNAKGKNDIIRKILFDKTNNELVYHFDTKKLMDIPDWILAYWIEKEHIYHFTNSKAYSEFGLAKQGLSSGNNKKFLRYWFEVNKEDTAIKYIGNNHVNRKTIKWHPLSKGGTYKKWYGNNELLINWENDGADIKNSKNSVVRNPQLFFNKGITWSALSSGEISFRICDEGFIFDSKGPMCFIKDEDNFHYIFALLNCRVISNFLEILAPSLDFTQGSILSLPIKINDKYKLEIKKLVEHNIQLSRTLWDLSELSWDFKKHPLLNEECTNLQEAYKKFVSNVESLYYQLSKNEFRLNEIFIEIYDMKRLIKNVENQGESLDLSESVIIKEFLSYFIGCLMGRYSSNITFDGSILTFTSKQYMDQDIYTLLKLFLKENFPEESLEENLDFIGNSLVLNKNEDVESRIRRYFIDDFYANHCNLFKKHPIYWLVDSGKQKGLRTLISMHRYQTDTMATIRFEHLQEIQAKYQNEINDLENRLVNASLSASEKKKLTAEKTTFEKKLDELREFDKRLAEIANEEIEIDLDDGVKVNYEKFYRGDKGVLAKIK